MADTLRLRLLGRPEVSLDKGVVTETLAAKAQAILYYLAVAGPFGQPRALLASLLWGDMPEAAARTNLRKALSNLRQVLDDFLDLDGQTVAFKPGCAYEVDVAVFVAKVGKITSSTVPVTQLQEAVALYQDDFLAGFYVREAHSFESWMLAEQARLRELMIQALQILAAHHAGQGDLAQGIGVVRRLLSLEPWREEAHRQLMRLLVQDGQRSAALAQYELCRQALAKALGVEPGLETMALYEQLRAGELGRGERDHGYRPVEEENRAGVTLVPSLPNPPASSPPRHNLPPQPTTFVGRATELADIIRRLTDKDCRLLTLVGAGGIGKTRLALQTAQLMLDSGAAGDFFSHGIIFTPLAGVSAAGGIAPAIASGANFNFSGNLPPQQQLLGYLQGKKMLLILDNLEHLLSPPLSEDTPSAMVSLMAELLQAAPGVKILATSREALNLQEEWFHPVEGLSFPPLLPPEEETRLENYDAVRLFVQNAQRARVQFSLAIEQAHVIRICQLVGGMPLALELAAAWLKVMPTAKIAREIEHNLDILTTRRQDLPERHRNIRAVFEHSWHLLQPQERGILQQLSVFRGSFDQEAAAAVAEAPMITLATLVEKSLVRVTEAGRYQMHELLRQFAAEKLVQAPEAHEQLQNRHCAYYAGWLAQQDTLLRTQRQLEAVRQINIDLENIEVAWRRAVEQGDAALLRCFFWSLWFVYEAKSWFHAGVELFSGAAAWLDSFQQGAPEEREVYAQLLAFQGRFQLRLHRLDQSERWMKQSVPVLRQAEAQRDLGLALQTLGLTAWVQGQFLEAQDYFEQSVAAAEQGGDLLIAAYSRSMSGFAAYGLGEYILAEQLIRERLPVLRQIGKLWGLVFSLAYLSSILSALERYPEAERVLLEGLAISREVEDRWAVADCLRRLGLLLTLMGEEKQAEAKPLLLEGVAIFREIDDHWGLTTTLNQLGQTCGALHDHEGAWQYLTEALEIAQHGGLTPIVLDILVNLAALYLQIQSFHGTPLKAVELLAVAINHPAGEQATKDRATRLLAEHEATLPADGITAAIIQSRNRTLEAVVAEILKK